MKEVENIDWTECHHIHPGSKGETCRCGEPASHKVVEDIDDDNYHPLGVCLCCRCFSELMGSLAYEICGIDDDAIAAEYDAANAPNPSKSTRLDTQEDDEWDYWTEEELKRLKRKLWEPCLDCGLKDAKIERLQSKIKRQADKITQLERSCKDMLRHIKNPNPSNSMALESVAQHLDTIVRHMKAHHFEWLNRLAWYVEDQAAKVRRLAGG